MAETGGPVVAEAPEQINALGARAETVEMAEEEAMVAAVEI